MSITKQYRIEVVYIPAVHDDRREDGTYLIKHFDEVQDALLNIDNRVAIIHQTPASDAYVECVVDSLDVAKHIEKVIQAVLTRYMYRVVN